VILDAYAFIGANLKLIIELTMRCRLPALGRLKIDDVLNFRRLLNGKIDQFLAFEDAVKLWRQ
jgi:hypothetical protein